MPHSMANVQMSDDDLHGAEPNEHQDSRAQRLKVKNRRKRYLDLHPEYFDSAELELAGLSFHCFLPDYEADNYFRSSFV